MSPRQYFVYILASKSRTVYIGVTSDLEKRVHQHKTKVAEGHTATYNMDRLVYFETTQNVEAAISREKQLKGWRRAKKIALIEATNPLWDDLSETWS